MMSNLNRHLISKGVPVIIGEWGTANDIKKDTDDYDVKKADKVAFARYFVEQAKVYDIASFYWMGLSNGNHRSVPEFNQADLKDAIIKGYYGEEGYSAITPLRSSHSTTAPFFNLHGQQVVTPLRGIFIQNRHKVIVR